MIFRCDAGHAPEIGTGHVARSKTLANNLVDKGLLDRSDIIFYTRNDSDYDLGEKYLAESGYEYQVFTNNELQANSSSELNILKNSNAILIVMDRLETTDDLIKGVSSSGKKIITFDDYGSGRVFADAFINAILHDIPANEAGYIGYDYLVLKSNGSSIKTEVPNEVNRIVASFGGHDSRNLMDFFLNNFQRDDIRLAKGTVIELLVGSESKKIIKCWAAQAEKISIKYDVTVSLLIRPPDFLERLAKADLAVLSGGLTIFDALSLGVPSIGLPQYLHQLETLKTLTAKMAIRLGSLEMKLDQKSFRRLFDEMMHSKDKRQLLKKNGPSLIDGKGTERVITILSNFIH